jgi:hypothetical protein
VHCAEVDCRESRHAERRATLPLLLDSYPALACQFAVIGWRSSRRSTKEPDRPGPAFWLMLLMASLVVVICRDLSGSPLPIVVGGRFLVDVWALWVLSSVMGQRWFVLVSAWLCIAPGVELCGLALYWAAMPPPRWILGAWSLAALVAVAIRSVVAQRHQDDRTLNG